VRLLFITSNRLGDAVLSTSVLRHFVETRPELRITVACGPVAAPIFEAVPNLERIIRMPKQKRGGHWWHLWKSVVTTWWDVIIDLRGSAIAFVLPGRKRIVLSGNDDSIHRVEQLGRLIGINPPPRPKIWLDQKHIDEAHDLLPQDGRLILAVGPTANWPGKMWPVERFVELVSRLRAEDGLLPNAHVIIAGAPNERYAAMPVIESIEAENRTILFGEFELLAVQACLSQADLYVGNDSGLMHMAAAADIPTLGLFGPSRAENYAPCGRHTDYVQTDGGYEKIISDGVNWKSIDCRMIDLSVEKVIDKLMVCLMYDWGKQ
jgi:ADP-heptose:LPS heptosyltransferase